MDRDGREHGVAGEQVEDAPRVAAEEGVVAVRDVKVDHEAVDRRRQFLDESGLDHVLERGEALDTDLLGVLTYTQAHLVPIFCIIHSLTAG